VKKLKVSTVKAPLAGVLLKPTNRSIATQTDVPTPKTRTIETQTDEQLSQETQTESATTSKKRQHSEQLQTSNRSKKAFEDLSMEEFLAGEDGDDDESCEVKDVCTVPTGYQMPSDDILREFIKSCHPVSPLRSNRRFNQQNKPERKREGSRLTSMHRPGPSSSQLWHGLLINIKVVGKLLSHFIVLTIL